MIQQYYEETIGGGVIVAAAGCKCSVNLLRASQICHRACGAPPQLRNRSQDNVRGRKEMRPFSKVRNAFAWKMKRGHIIILSILLFRICNVNKLENGQKLCVEWFGDRGENSAVRTVQ